MAFLARAVAFAFGAADDVEDGFSGFFWRFRHAFRIAAPAGAIAGPIEDSEGFAVFSLNEFRAFAGGGIAFGIPIGIWAVFGMAFATDAAAMSRVHVSRFHPPIRFGTIWHD